MITLWLNQQIFKDPFYTLKLTAGQFPDSLDLQSLKPGITVNTDDLEDAFGLCQNLGFNDDSYIVRGNRYRSASVGDIFQKSDNTCHFIADQGFHPIKQSAKPTLKQQLPHVGNWLFPDEGDPFETFPTLDLDFGKSRSISTISIINRFHYLEAREWQNGQKRLLLGTYK